jgi:Holliday junction resolvase RusA-like endonuclease
VSERVLMFTVAGLPQTKGSTKSFAYTPKAGGRPRVKTMNDNPKNRGWQQTIANCAALELQRAAHRGCRFVDGGVYFEVVFYLPRPKNLLTKSKALVAIPHTKKPDLDKLLRAAKDALTGIVWTDDSQVVHVVGRKNYCAAGEFPRAVIQVRDALKESKESA